VAFVCESLVLGVQALFFGAGGVTVLAVNALAMGLAGPLVGWLLYRALRRVNEKAALFLAGYGSMQVAAFLVALVLGLQHRIDPHYFPMPPAVTITAVMVPSLTVAGLAEGAYTLFAHSLLRRAKLALP
jgi:cobalt/nickel transport system permease protein